MAKLQKLEIQARKEILSSALSLFAKKGFHAVSVRELAKASGQNIAMISYYFGGKEGLYKTILTEYIEDTTKQVKDILLSGANKEMTAASFKNNMKAVIALMVEMKMNNPEIINLLQREKVNGMPFARELHDQYIGPLAQEVLLTFEEAKRKKILRTGVSPGLFMGLLVEAIHGYMISNECGGTPIKGEFKFPRDKQKFIDLVTDLFLEGMMR